MGTEDDLLENIWGDFLIESDRRSSDMWYSYILGDLGSTKYDQYLEASDKCIVTDSEIGILIYHGIEQYVELYKNREEFIIDLMCVNTTYDTVILRQM